MANVLIMRLFFEIAFKNFYKFLFHRKYRTYYWLLFKYGNYKRHQISTVKFNDYRILVADHLSFVFQFREIFLDESYKFTSSNKNPIIIDCGSNIGMGVLYYKQKYPHSEIYCIEADKAIANILTKNIESNQLKNVQVIAKAAWLNNDGVYFNADGADGGNIASEGEKIESLDFNQFLSTFEEIDFIKIDIEGAEKVLVPKCFDSLSKAKNIFLEYHTSYNDQQNLSEILAGFESRGYKYFLKSENKRESPFVNKNEHKAFDLQLNIFLYR